LDAAGCVAASIECACRIWISAAAQDRIDGEEREHLHAAGAIVAYAEVVEVIGKGVA
jgi:hypothetical protein